MQRIAIPSYLFPVPCSLFPVPCSLKSRNCVPQKSYNCYIILLDTNNQTLII
ncbi:MAG: hypothetical protein F6K50_24645 [Moorea sp. SIO3I7]|uniref:hypothetical protein n=1 Tax=Moorena sp. SIO4A5 TaxID=2607838 RepID=UPI0013CDD738|nr:hypothetical protein [Moorena sp. SIO4A5]NEN98583.1 hypothetical protein [Moorena sp. SIO3I7]NEO25056.1 hypothetical protein [Moorena sp. SIO4A5]NEO44418.1 hypothetical protein [Moorena sp. SIO4A3]